MEKEANRTLNFLDVCLNNKDPSCLIVSVYCKKTSTGLLNNFFSFTSFSYHLGLVCTLLDRACKINNTLLAFYENVKKFSNNLERNHFPEHLIDKIVNTHHDKVADSATHFNDYILN